MSPDIHKTIFSRLNYLTESLLVICLKYGWIIFYINTYSWISRFTLNAYYICIVNKQFKNKTNIWFSSLLLLCSDAIVYTLDFMEIPLQKNVIVNCKKLTCTIELIHVFILFSTFCTVEFFTILISILI